MNNPASKIELVKLILSIENEQFIEKITEFIKIQKVDFWGQLSLDERAEIEKGIHQLDKGQKTSFKSFLKKIS